MTRNVCIHSILTDVISRGIWDWQKQHDLFTIYATQLLWQKEQFMYRIKWDKLKLNVVPRVSEYISCVCFGTWPS